MPGYLTLIAAASYGPLIITVALYIRARRSRYAWQAFNDSIRALGGHVTLPSFLLLLPVLVAVLFDNAALADCPWDKTEMPVIVLMWLGQYPLTLLAYHALKSRLKKAEPYARPYPAFANIGLDVLKHGFLLLIFFVSMYAGNQTLAPDRIQKLRGAAEHLFSSRIIFPLAVIAALFIHKNIDHYI